MLRTFWQLPSHAIAIASRQAFSSTSSRSYTLQNEAYTEIDDDIGIYTENESEENRVYPKSNYTIKIDDMTPEDPDSIKYVQDENNRVKYEDCGVDQYGLNPRLMSLTDYFSGNLHHTHHVFYNTNNVLARQGKKTESRTFIDLKVIKVRSGNGGNGCVSYFRDANRPSGPPDGGDGGDGGDVYISVAEKNMSSLHKVKRNYEAKHGTAGKGSQLDGKSGEDIVIEVPVGTTIRWIPDPAVLKKFLRQREGKDLDDIKIELRCDEYDHIQLVRPGYEPGSGWSFKEGDKEYYEDRPFFQELNKKVMEYDRELVHEELKFDKFPLLGLDLSRPSKKPMLLLKGGKGGMGNMHFLTKDIRNPNFSKKGRDGIQTHFLLELKLIADLGLVGLPNAGKSTLLRAISRARPRVGHWEFTTLQPTVGTIFTTIDKDPFTVADIPGIIKGASENKGMGLDFLRHIERSGGLVFVVSLESENPVADLEVLLNEVGSKRMKDKEVLVVATKADLTADGANYKILRHYVETDNSWKIVPVCAMKGQNIEKCIKLMGEIAYMKNAKLV